MSTIEIRSSPSGPIVAVLTPPDVAFPDPTKYLSETGEYTVPAGGGGAVDSVQGSDGITPTTPQTGVVVLSGDALLPRDGSRAMTGTLDMGGQDISNADAFTGNSFNGVALTTGGTATNYLGEDGIYHALPADAVTSVQGSNGITPTTPQTGVVVLSGAALLPLDGSRAMTGTLDMGGQDISNAGSITATDFNGVALTTGGAATNYLDETGNYSVPSGQVTGQQNVDYNICITQNLATNTAYYCLMVAMEDMVLNQGAWDLAVTSSGNFQVGIYSYPANVLQVSSAITAFSTTGVKVANFTGTLAVPKFGKFWMALWTNATPQAKAFNAAGGDGIRSQQAGLGGGLPGSFVVAAQSFTPWVAVGSA